MTTDIITRDEAQQRAELARPLWPIYSTFSHCTGLCKQGRSLCLTPEACQTGQAQDDKWKQKPPMTRSDALLSLALVFACWGAVAAVLMAFGVRL